MQSPAIFAQLNAQKQQQSLLQGIDHMDKNGGNNKRVSFGLHGMAEETQKYGPVHNAPAAMPTPGTSKIKKSASQTNGVL